MTANNGWPGKPGVPLDTPEGNKLKMDAGIPHLPTQLTYDCRAAIGGKGPLAYTWQDKPHRLVYDLCREIERIAAGATPDEATALQKRVAKLETALQFIKDAPDEERKPNWNNMGSYEAGLRYCAAFARAALTGGKDE